MSHIELITSIRAELHDGNHLDAWELALESQDAVAIAYVEAGAPLAMFWRGHLQLGGFMLAPAAPLARRHGYVVAYDVRFRGDCVGRIVVKSWCLKLSRGRDYSRLFGLDNRRLDLGHQRFIEWLADRLGEWFNLCARRFQWAQEWCPMARDHVSVARWYTRSPCQPTFFDSKPGREFLARSVSGFKP